MLFEPANWTAKPPPPHAAPVSADRDHGSRRWAVLFVSSIGVFLASVSTSALIIAFPKLIIELNTQLGTMMYVLLVVLLMIACVTPIAGKLGDIFGQAPLYKFGFGLFVLGSLGGGLCQHINNGYDLVGARIVIGLGGAFLFTNSAAILTDAFAPYNQVGLAQGVFQLTAAFGTVLGPLIGGGLVQVDWRWIFFYNVPVGGLCFLLALWAVRDTRVPVARTWDEHRRRFDWIGSITCILGLVLLLLAMIQAVAPDPVLSQPGPLAGLLVGGCASGLIFITSQFYAVDPLIPPKIFLNRTFAATTAGATCMAFARNSVTYNMIFYLQGPHGLDPLGAGIALIPFGIGIMVAGFGSGAVADKVGVRNMAMAGPLVLLCGCVGLQQLQKGSGLSGVGGLLFLCGLGVGLFQSPNGMANMLSVLPQQRGVAAAISMLTMMFTSMCGIVVTFSFVLNSMSQADLFTLFIYGGGALSDAAVHSCLNALSNDYFILFAALLGCSICASVIPADFSVKAVPKSTAPLTPMAVAAAEATLPDAAEAWETQKSADWPLKAGGGEDLVKIKVEPAVAAPAADDPLPVATLVDLEGPAAELPVPRQIEVGGPGPS